MLLWIIGTLSRAVELAEIGGPIYVAGGVAVIFVLIVWALGSLILGLLALMARGRG